MQSIHQIECHAVGFGDLPRSDDRPVVTNDAIRRQHYGTQGIPNLLKPKATIQQPANQLLAFFPRPPDESIEQARLLDIVEILRHLTKLQGVSLRGPDAFWTAAPTLWATLGRSEI